MCAFRTEFLQSKSVCSLPPLQALMAPYVEGARLRNVVDLGLNSASGYIKVTFLHISFLSCTMGISNTMQNCFQN